MDPLDPKDQVPGGPQEPGGAAETSGLAPCYRHPDRETGIRCVRCKRPICPECMISASVGFQCPECVREGSASSGAASGSSGDGGGARRWGGVRADNRPRTVAGGVITRDTRLVTKILLGLNIAVFVLVHVVSDPNRLLSDLFMIGAWPNPDTGIHPVMGVADGEWYRLLTATFLHEEIWHIGFNMLSLWVLGGPLEAALGRARFLAVYLLSGLGGSVLTYLIASPTEASLGASGAIFGLFGATGVLVRRLRADFRPFAAILAINLIFTFTWSGIAWQAHVGGLIVGAAIAWAIVYAPPERRRLVQWGSCSLALVVLVAAVAVRTALLV